jgi:hypothetical protein
MKYVIKTCYTPTKIHVSNVKIMRNAHHVFVQNFFVLPVDQAEQLVPDTYELKFFQCVLLDKVFHRILRTIILV